MAKADPIKLNLRGVHVFKKIAGKPGQFKLDSVHPVMGLVCQGEGKLFIQDGRVYAAGGDPIPTDQLPAWFHEQVAQIAKTSPKALADVGYALPAARKAA